MMNIVPEVLSKTNYHIRDHFIQFQEHGHKYTILTDPESKYTSVTTWNHSHFPYFNADEIINNMMKSKSWKEGHKYWGLTIKQIKDMWDKNRDTAANAGTNMHYEIECFMNNNNCPLGYTHHELYELYMNENKEKIDQRTLEWKYFLQFVEDHPNLKPYRTEWMIYHEEIKLAGSIDMVYENEDGTLSIYDWKRATNITTVNSWNKFARNKLICHIPDSNFWHYALQLNTYKAILEQKYEKKVKNLFLVRLHPESTENTYELINLPILEKEITDLFEERKKEICG